MTQGCDGTVGASASSSVAQAASDKAPSSAALGACRKIALRLARDIGDLAKEQHPRFDKRSAIGRRIIGECSQGGAGIRRSVGSWWYRLGFRNTITGDGEPIRNPPILLLEITDQGTVGRLIRDGEDGGAKTCNGRKG